MTKESEWVTFNPLTQTYDTPDGTTVPMEMLEPPLCLADVFAVALLRAKQRKQLDQNRSKT